MSGVQKRDFKAVVNSKQTEVVKEDDFSEFDNLPEIESESESESESEEIIEKPKKKSSSNKPKKTSSKKIKPENFDLNELEKSDILEALNRWISTHTKDATNHPSGKTARELKRMKKLRAKFDQELS